MLGVLNNQSGAGATTMTSYLTPINTGTPAAASANPIAAPVAAGGSTLAGQPMIMLFGLIALILLAKWATESRASEMELAHIHVGGYNFLMITVIAIVGIDIFKLIFTRWNVPGLSPVVQMA